MKKHRIKLRPLLFAAIALFAMGSNSALADSSKSPITANLGYVALGDYTPETKSINPIRLTALRETATELGARGALAWRSKQIDTSLEQEANYLDQVFDFNQLLLNHNVLPPVLVQADNSINMDGDDTIRIAAKTYKIFQQARFVTAAPTWRTYLWMDYPKPDMPSETLLPQNRAEATVWNQFLKEGWAEGLTQANEIFETNLNRLKRDYMGMILYRKLLAQHMVSSPYVAEANLGVTGDSNQLEIGDRVLRITRHSALQINSSEWKPVLTK